MEKAPLPPPPDDFDFGNRKLIRPTIQRPDGSAAAAAAPAPAKEARKERSLFRRPHAPEQTHAETFYFQKQVAAQTMMNIVLMNGETVHGVIAWYDRNSIKLHRPGRPNLLLYK